MLSTVLVLLSLRSFVYGYTSDEVKLLKKYLFETKSYDKTLRPATNQLRDTILTASFFLMGLNKLDELEGKLTTTAYLTLSWQDDFLTWNSSVFPIHRLVLPQDQLWKPDFVLKNGFTEFKELGASFCNVILSFDGSVFWKPYQVFQSQCSIDVTYFPFDSQTCDIQFTLWSHYRVKLDSYSANVEMSGFIPNNIWDIVSTYQTIDNSQEHSQITFSLILKRKPTFYVNNTVVPILFLGVLNLLVFVIPADAGEKMSYAITVALGFIVFLTIISTELPANSDSTPYLSTYLQIQIFMGGIALVISAIQLRLRHKPEDQQVYTFLKILVKITHFKQSRKQKVFREEVGPADVQMEEKGGESQENDAVSWNDVTSAIDFLMFWLHLLIYCITTSAILTIMMN